MQQEGLSNLVRYVRTAHIKERQLLLQEISVHQLELASYLPAESINHHLSIQLPTKLTSPRSVS